MKPIAKGLLISCGTLSALAVAGLIGFVVWIFLSPEGGVKVGNQMDQYALDYIAQHKLLAPGESILAYYDATISMDGTEASIITPARVIYHKDGKTTSIPIQEIEDVRHRQEALIGDVFEVQSKSGEVMKIEIAPLNQGETFKNVLMNVWNKAKTKQGG